ncbi:MAG TPA: RagB/SusD family nutrient uptake outer membrane protein [Saprospiraceae bacterium]|nr:RagB/SusD family nutrient uptake outer membrane protein [Saprospiraceae bacterium]HMP22666.1 RagB/SusD family nutrient uptake outer membrane protein [Saprospiraceae bacterium]
MRNILFFTLLLSLASCSEDFINLAPISQSNSANFYKTADDINQAVIAAYDALQEGGQYADNGFDHYMEVRSDNTYNDNVTQSAGNLSNFDNFALRSDNPRLNTTWSSCYRGIQRCNIVLNRIGAIEMDETIRNIRKGEVKFLRALTYFNLVRIWGDVPLVLNEIENTFEAFEHTRQPKDEVYAEIIKDLQEAAAALPNSFDAANVGRATKGAAQTLLGKVYLTRGQYNEAATILEQVINVGTYKLLDNFKAVFEVANKNNAESIFEVQFKSGTNGEGLNITPPWDPSDANNRPSNNILNFFVAENDPRLDMSVDTASGKPYSAKRVDVRGSDGAFGFNVMVLRYADVLLMAAEALNEVGYNNGKAFDYLNQVRSRVGVPTYTTATLPNQQNFRLAIEKERRLELAFENHRWFDLLRTGRALDVMKAAAGGNDASALAYTITENQLLFPIPQTQIDASGGKLTQNPGY